MQEEEPGAVGVDEQVVEPVLGFGCERQFGLSRKWNLRRVCEREDQLLLAGAHINAPDASVFGREHAKVRVGNARVAVAGPRVVESAEVRRDAPAAVGTEAVERIWQRALFAALHVENVRDEMVALAVVPRHLALTARHPLHHAALLPVPSAGDAEFGPLVAVLRVHHADANHVIRRR